MDISQTANQWIIRAENEADTMHVATLLASLLLPGDILCLSGDLGAGKTTFTRALTAALGSPSQVSSPTFTLIHEYSGGRIPVFHADAYRLQGAVDAASTGLEDYLFRGDGITVIEWPEKIVHILPADRLDITLSEEGEGRSLTFIAHSHRSKTVLENLHNKMETEC